MPSHDHGAEVVGQGDVLHVFRYVVGSSRRVVNVRIFTTHIGLVSTAVAASENMALTTSC